MDPLLHLPSLDIKGFRGIRSLELPRLGRVTLLVGNNGIGKTTILDAIRIYASRGDTRAILDLIEAREEFFPDNNEEGGKSLFPDFTSLFYGYDYHNCDDVPPKIRLGSQPKGHTLSLQLVDNDNFTVQQSLFGEDIKPRALGVSVGKHSRIFPVAAWDTLERHRRSGFPSRTRRPGNSKVWPGSIHFESLGPGTLHAVDVARLWDSVALTESEDFVTRALRLIVGDTLERLAVIGDPTESFRARGRRVVAKLTSSSAPIPLKRLGDGANRLLGIALALANCRDGILLIDEVENGIHYSIQPDLWRMIFEAAEEGNVQVIAATHSWDCVFGFAAAAIEAPADGIMYRLDRYEDDLAAVEYSEENLGVAAQQRIEVR